MKYLFDFILNVGNVHWNVLKTTIDQGTVCIHNNAHHQIETVFKAFGRAVRMAMEADPRMQGTIPSTKGSL